MKRYLKILIIFICIAVLVGSAYIFWHESPILPPTRYGNKTSRISLERQSFETAISSSDAIAHIKVGNWLGEDEYFNYYEATVISQFKGEEIDNFVLIQDGTSEYTIGRYPLFTYGNEMLLFLMKSTDADYENAYWILGSYTTVMDAVTSSTNEVYYMDRYGVLSETAENINNIPQSSFAFGLFNKIGEQDPYITENRLFFYTYFYSEKDMKKLIDSILKEEGKYEK